MKRRFEQILQTLTPDELSKIGLKYDINVEREYTLEEVGRIFKITNERMKQVQEKIVRSLQHPVRARKLEGFLDNIQQNSGDERREIK